MRLEARAYFKIIGLLSCMLHHMYRCRFTLGQTENRDKGRARSTPIVVIIIITVVVVIVVIIIIIIIIEESALQKEGMNIRKRV